MPKNNRTGPVYLVPLVFTLTLAAFGFYFLNYGKVDPASTEASSMQVVVTPVIPTDSPVPTIEPSLTPSPAITITPSPAPTVKPTPRPTAVPFSGVPSDGLSRVTVATAKGNFSATVISYDLSRVKVITDTGNDDNCSTGCVTRPLMDYVTARGGFGGINGTYFCPASYPDCAGKTDSYDFPVYNTRLSKWINADKLSWSNRRAIFYVDGSGAHYQNNSAGFGGGLTAGIINYPGLVDGGNVQIDDNQSGLSDKQKVKNTKLGIGLRDSSHVLVVVAQNVTMLEFAHVFKSLGATGALNLDTGGSLAVVHGGRYVIGPGRNLPNAVIFANK